VDREVVGDGDGVRRAVEVRNGAGNLAEVGAGDLLRQRWGREPRDGHLSVGSDADEAEPDEPRFLLNGRRVCVEVGIGRHGRRRERRLEVTQGLADAAEL
jgi:hypothetical protein